MNHTHDQVFPALLSEVRKHEKSSGLPPDRTTRSLKGRQFQDVSSSQSGPVYLLLKLSFANFSVTAPWLSLKSKCTSYWCYTPAWVPHKEGGREVKPAGSIHCWVKDTPTSFPRQRTVGLSERTGKPWLRFLHGDHLSGLKSSKTFPKIERSLLERLCGNCKKKP